MLGLDFWCVQGPFMHSRGPFMRAQRPLHVLSVTLYEYVLGALLCAQMPLHAFRRPFHALRDTFMRSGGPFHAVRDSFMQSGAPSCAHGSVAHFCQLWKKVKGAPEK